MMKAASFVDMLAEIVSSQPHRARGIHFLGLKGFKGALGSDCRHRIAFTFQSQRYVRERALNTLSAEIQDTLKRLSF